MADLEARGIPTVFVSTTQFVDAAEAQSKALGLGPPRVYLPHPIQDRTDTEMVTLAEAHFEAVLAELLAP